MADLAIDFGEVGKLREMLRQPDEVAQLVRPQPAQDAAQRLVEDRIETVDDVIERFAHPLAPFHGARMRIHERRRRKVADHGERIAPFAGIAELGTPQRVDVRHERPDNVVEYDTAFREIHGKAVVGVGTVAREALHLDAGDLDALAVLDRHVDGNEARAAKRNMRAGRRVRSPFGGVVVELLGRAGDLQRRSLGIEIAGAAAAEIGVEPGMTDDRNLCRIIDQGGGAMHIVGVRVDHGDDRFLRDRTDLLPKTRPIVQAFARVEHNQAFRPLDQGEVEESVAAEHRHARHHAIDFRSQIGRLLQPRVAVGVSDRPVGQRREANLAAHVDRRRAGFACHRNRPLPEPSGLNR